MKDYQNNVFIDPASCGSSVGYHITTSEHEPNGKPKVYSVNAVVVLADCGHKIDWTFYDECDCEKIDAAIEMLQEFRRKFAMVTAQVAKLNGGDKC